MVSSGMLVSFSAGGLGTEILGAVPHPVAPESLQRSSRAPNERIEKK